MNAPARIPFDQLPAPQQAGILSHDPQFQKFAATRSGFPDHQFAAEAAAQYIREICNITSRRDLATLPDAADRFQRLRTDFDAWRGRIASPERF